MAMSIAPSEMPFHVPDEPIRKFGSTDQLLLGHELPVEQERSGLVAAQAHRVPLLGLGLDVGRVDDEHGQVGVVAVVVGRGRLQDVEVGEAGRRRPGRLLEHLEAAVGAPGARCDRIPEVRPGLRVGVRERAEQPAANLAQILLDRVVGGPQLERLHRADVHHVAHRAGRIAVPGDGLGGRGVHHVILAEAAPLLRQHEPQEPVRAQSLEALAGEGEGAIVLRGERPDRLGADLAEPLQQAELLLGQEPLGIEHRVEPVHGRLGCDRCHTESSFVVALGALS
jgi:hypothetical protein